MPGVNCATFGCSTCRGDKGIFLYKVPAGKDQFSRWCYEKLIAVIVKNSMIDQSLKMQIENKSLHFSEDQLIFRYDILLHS